MDPFKVWYIDCFRSQLYVPIPHLIFFSLTVTSQSHGAMENWGLITYRLVIHVFSTILADTLKHNGCSLRPQDFCR